jgi:hypothetical protein
MAAKLQMTKNFENEKSDFRTFATPLIKSGFLLYWIEEAEVMDKVRRETFWCKCKETVDERTEKELFNLGL